MSDGTSKLVFEVAADPSGLNLLRTEFDALKSGLTGLLGEIRSATASTGAKSAADMLQLKGAVSSLSAEVEVLSQKTIKGTAATSADTEAKKAAAAATKELTSMAQAENNATQMVIAASVKDAAARKASTGIKSLETEITKLQTAALQEHLAAIALVAAEEVRVTAASAAAAAAQVKATEADFAGAVAAFELQKADRAKAVSTEAATLAARANSAANLSNAAAANEAHAAMRGLAGGMGALWMSYSAILPLMAGFAVAAGLKEAIAGAAAFQYQMTFVGALTGAARDEVDKLSQGVLDLSKNSLFGPQQAAEGMRTLAQAGFTAQQALEVLPAVLNLATVGETSVAEAAFTASSVMHAFGLEIYNVTEIVDKLALAGTLSVTSVKGIMQSMTQASTVAEQYDVSLNTTLAALTAMAERGITNTKAGTAFSQMVTNLYNPSAKAAAILETLGIKAYDATNHMRPLTVIMGELSTALQKYDEKGQAAAVGGLSNVRGSKAVSAIVTSIGEVAAVEERLGKAAGFASDVTEKLKDTVKGEWTQAINTLEASLIEVGTTSEGPLLEAVKSLKVAFGSPEFKEFAANILGGFVDLLTWVTTHGPAIITFIEGLLLYKVAGGFVALNAALAGVAATAATGAAATIASVGSKGLVGLALFGAYELTTLAVDTGLGQKLISAIGDAAVEEAQKFDSTLSKVKAGYAEFLSWKKGNAGGPGTSTIVNGDSFGLVNSSASIDAARREMRRREDASFVPVHNDKVIGTKTLNINAAKEAAAAASLAVSAEMANYQVSEAALKVDTDSKLKLLQAYQSAHLITEVDFLSKESAILADNYTKDQSILSGHIARLQAQWSAAKPAERQKIAADIEKAKETFAANQQKRDDKELSDQAQISAKETQYGLTAIDRMQKKNDALDSEVKAMYALDPLQANSVLNSNNAAIAHLQESVALEKLTAAHLQELSAANDDSEQTQKRLGLSNSTIAKLEDEIAKLKQLGAGYVALQKQKIDAENDWKVGAAQGLNEYLNKTTSVAAGTKDLIVKSFKGMEDALVTFVTTGKLSFKSLVDSMIADIARMAIQQQITAPLAAGFNSLLSGGSFSAGASSTSSGGGVIGSLFNQGSSVGSSVASYHPSGSAGGYGYTDPKPTAGGDGTITMAGAAGLFAAFAGVAASASQPSTRATEVGGAASGAMLGAQIGSMIAPGIGTAVGAVIGGLAGLIAGSSNKGDAQRTAQFGTDPTGKYNGMGSVSDSFGTFGTFKDQWFSDADQKTQMQQFMSQLGLFEDSLAKIMKPEQVTAAAAALNTSKTYGFGLEHTDMADSLAIIFKDRMTDIVTAVSPTLGQLVANFKGTGAELQSFVLTLVTFSTQIESLAAVGVDANKILGAFKTASSQTVLDVVSILGYLGGDPIKEANDALAKQNASLFSTWNTSGAAIRALTATYDGSAAATSRLAALTTARYQTELQLATQIATVLASSHTMITDSIAAMRYSVLDAQGKYNFLDKQSAGEMDQLNKTSDPAVIAALGAQLNKNINDAFALLSPEEQKQRVEEFVTRLTTVDSAVSARLATTQATLAADRNTAIATSVAAAITTAFSKFVADNAAAAATNLQASNNNLTASDTPLRVDVTVNAAASVEVSG